MVTYGWHLEARLGRSIRRAFRPSRWRSTPTSWQLRTPTNLEVRPLPGQGSSSPTLATSSSTFTFYPPFFLFVPSLLLCLCHACAYLLSGMAIPLSALFSNVWTRFQLLEMFFSIECHYPACWQQEALAALQTFVNMSKFSTVSQSILFICCIHLNRWEVENRVMILCMFVYVLICVWSNCAAWRDILTHSICFAAQLWRAY